MSLNIPYISSNDLKFPYSGDKKASSILHSKEVGLNIPNKGETLEGGRDDADDDDDVADEDEVAFEEKGDGGDDDDDDEEDEPDNKQ